MSFCLSSFFEFARDEFSICCAAVFFSKLNFKAEELSLFSTSLSAFLAWRGLKLAVERATEASTMDKKAWSKKKVALEADLKVQTGIISEAVSMMQKNWKLDMSQKSHNEICRENAEFALRNLEKVSANRKHATEAISWRRT